MNHVKLWEGKWKNPYVHPYYREDEPILTIIFFKWVGEKPPTMLYPKDPITLSNDEQGVYNHLRNARYLGSFITILSFGDPGSLGIVSGASKMAPQKNRWEIPLCPSFSTRLFPQGQVLPFLRSLSLVSAASLWRHKKFRWTCERHGIWANYSDLTRPHPKEREIPLFQGNLGR